MKKTLVSVVTLTILLIAFSILFPSFVQAASIHVEAFVDGRSQLIIKGNTAQWQHFEASAPGIPQNPPENYPTIINSTNWIPSWAGDPSNCGGCYSSTFSEVCPGLGAVTQTVALNIIQARESVSISQQPSFGNDYTLIVEFNDNVNGGAAWYIIDLNFPTSVSCRSAAVPTMTEWGMIIFVVFAGLGAVYYLRRQKRANN
jgi:hypothetical protein